MSKSMKRLPGSEESKDLCYGLFTMSDSDLEHLVNLSHSFLICKLQGANPLLGASIQIDLSPDITPTSAIPDLPQDLFPPMMLQA